MDEALRFNEGKPQLGYILHFPHALEAVCRVLEYGATKYGALNWKRGNKPDTEYLDAALRHLFAWQNESHFDEESGCNHLAHAVWNLLTLLDLNYPKEAVNGVAAP